MCGNTFGDREDLVGREVVTESWQERRVCNSRGKQKHLLLQRGNRWVKRFTANVETMEIVCCDVSRN